MACLQGIDRGYYLLDKQQSLAPEVIARVRTPHLVLGSQQGRETKTLPRTTSLYNYVIRARATYGERNGERQQASD